MTDLDPGAFRKTGPDNLQRQRKSGSRFLARQGDGNDSAGTRIENVFAQYQNRTPPGLLMPECRVEFGLNDFAF